MNAVGLTRVRVCSHWIEILGQPGNTRLRLLVCLSWPTVQCNGYKTWFKKWRHVEWIIANASPWRINLACLLAFYISRQTWTCSCGCCGCDGEAILAETCLEWWCWLFLIVYVRYKSSSSLLFIHTTCQWCPTCVISACDLLNHHPINDIWMHENCAGRREWRTI